MYDLLVILLLSTDTKVSLRAAVQGMRDILGDNERMQGKWNKDDKVHVTLHKCYINGTRMIRYMLLFTNVT